LKKLAVIQGLFAIGFCNGDSVLKLDLLVFGMFLGRLFVEVKVRRERGVEDLCSDLGLFFIVGVILFMFLFAKLLQFLLFLHLIYFN
jgi:hypothetical protein